MALQLSKGISSTAEFVPALVVHDDQDGMYLRMEVRALSSPYEPFFQEAPTYRSELVLGIGGEELTAKCEALFVPLPRRVVLPGAVALRRAAFWLDYNRDQIGKGDLVLRAFLMRSNRFKEALADRESMPMSLRIAYRMLPMPRYIWVIEYGYSDDWSEKSIDDLLVVGEVILDSTEATGTTGTLKEEINFLAIHTPGTVTVRHLKDERMLLQTYAIKPDSKYPPLHVGIRP
jgi:hypothetical protein